jgi:hypothetical protein
LIESTGWAFPSSTPCTMVRFQDSLF